MRVFPASKKGAFFIVSAVLSTGLLYHLSQPRPGAENRETASLVNPSLQPGAASKVPFKDLDEENGLNKKSIAKAFQSLGKGKLRNLPSELDLEKDGEKERSIIQYSFDSKLQETMEKLFTTYGPDYGAFVALDARTGRVLSMVSYSRNGDINENLALRATFPSASIFKVVTAAAAIGEKNYSANTIIPFNGRNHTLYRSNILQTNVTRWTRYMTLQEAFAKSVNTVFGKIGAYTVSPAELREYAARFGFNRKIPSDLPVQQGRATISDDAWGLAEVASGYTRETTMSPMHGALIAAAVVNDGIIMEPYVVESAHDKDGTPVYQAEPRVMNLAIGPGTASEMRSLMRATVQQGTSRKAFRGFFRGGFTRLDVGGKTGSLTGTDPQGKYDWFVGFADDGDRKIAIASLTVHQKLWRVKSSYLARRAVETYFQGSPHGAGRSSQVDGGIVNVPMSGRRQVTTKQ